MADRYIITQSLLYAYNYAMDCWEACKEEAYADFLATLRREPRETTPEMQNGIDFENAVYAEAHGKPRDVLLGWEHGISLVADKIRNAPNQIPAEREFEIDGITILAYGILDAMKCGTIYDVKFSNKGFGSMDCAGKYLDSPQHSEYLFLIPEAKEFTYLLSDGEDLYTETYNRRNTRPFPEIVKEFLDGIKAMGLYEVYLEHWKAKR